MHILNQPNSLWIGSQIRIKQEFFQRGNIRAGNLFLLDQNTKALFSKTYSKSSNNLIVQFGTEGFDGLIISGGMDSV